jgi:hypothetical protein
LSDGKGSRYLAWNDAIASRFFNPDRAGEPVFLFVTDEILAEVGQQLGESPDEFIAAILAGPPGTTRSGHCQRALQVGENWRDHGYEYPPYIAYLALFVLAAGHEGHFDPRDYYPRLWDLLGEPRSGTPPSFDRMWELWQDLEQWSMHDRHEELGAFEARIVGGKDLIGFPLAQAVLTEAESRALPRIFADAGLEPGTVPARRELRRALVVQGRYTLRRQTVAALERDGDSFADAILDVVADSFLEWDGQIPEPAGASGRTISQVTAGLRLCLDVDRVARRATITLRCHSRREVPAGGLVLQGGQAGDLVCHSYLPQWSAPLSLANDGLAAPFTPKLTVWASGLSLNDPHLGWTLRLRPARVRAFVEGGAEQLPGLIEILEIPRLRAFYLAFAESAQPVMGPWLDSECEGWQEISLAAGLPPGWTFGMVRTAANDRGPREADDALGFPERRALQLVGGIRAGAGNTFFSFAPPRVLLAGAVAGDTVYCDCRQLGRSDSSEQVYSLPSDLPVDTRISLDVRQGDEVLKRRSLYLVSGAGWHLDAPLVLRDDYGAISDVGEIAGAQAPEPRATLKPDPLRTPGLDDRAPRVYFVGQLSGQICVWPSEPLPSWDPVWAVTLGRRRGKAHYCGMSFAAEAPRQCDSEDRDRLRLWHDILWHRRERIDEPREPTLRSLWRQYVEAARD